MRNSFTVLSVVKIIFLIGISSFLFTFPGCLEEEELSLAPPKNCNPLFIDLPDQVGQWIGFEQGSFWVYQDSLLNQSITVKVNDYSISQYKDYGSPDPGGDFCSCLIEKLEIDVTCQVDSLFADSISSQFSLGDGCKNNPFLNERDSLLDHEYLGSRLLRFPIQTDGKKHCIVFKPGLEVCYIYLDSLDFWGNTFADVLRVVKRNATPSQDIYFAKSIGIIRREIFYDEDTTIYQLVDWEIQ